MKNGTLRWMLPVLALALLVPAASAQTVAEEIALLLEDINTALAADGADYLVAMAEYVTVPGQEMGNTVFANDVGNKQLGFDFVPGDARRTWSAAGGNAITYAIDSTGDAVPLAGVLTGAATTAAIVRGHDSWEALACSNLGQSQNPDFGIDIGVVAFINGLGGSPFVFADVQHAGWRDINFGGGTLGVTFTFGFTSGGVFTDIDNNGKLDAAFREIYYDPIDSSGVPRVWADDGVTNFDVETVALHEVGHGLSQGHFGKVFLDNNGVLKFAPEAVMNAVYVGPRQGLLGTDNGGHCSNWGEWPNN